MRSRDTLNLSCELLERLRFVGQMACLEDAAFAVVQYIDRSGQRLALTLRLVLFDDDGLGRRGLIDEVVLPFIGFASLRESAH